MATVTRTAWLPLVDSWYDIQGEGRAQAARVTVKEQGRAITINADFEPSLWLPADIRLCRLVTVQIPDAVAMPVEVREVMREALDSWMAKSMNDYNDGHLGVEAFAERNYREQEAEAWLEAQERGGGDGAS